MRKSLAMKSVGVIVAGALAVGLSGFAYADAGEVNAADAVAAIQSVAPGALVGLARVDSDSDAAVEASVPEGTIAVPVDPTDGIDLGDSVQIGLPFARHASNAADTPVPGVVAFDNNNGSTTVPVILADGTLQINTVIENASAPKRYDYPIDVPEGARLTQDANGTVAVVAADGSPLRVFGDAWAKDANGTAVPTHYEVQGNTLTQVVNFTAETTFPVVADPSTGVYSYNCVNSNGSSYFMKPGETMTNCKGAFLQKYINGAMVQSVKLAYGGGAGAKPPANAVGCTLAVASGVALVFFPPSGAVAWFVQGGLAAAGLLTGCVTW